MREVRVAVSELLGIVARLKQIEPRKEFTLDGRLVGDIGEVLAAAEYELELFKGVVRHYDAELADGRRVQIKATMKEYLTFPADHTPELYLGLKIHPDGSIEEIFNGPGSIAGKAIEGRKHPKTNLHSISLSGLRRLSEGVDKADRVPRRKTFSVGSELM